MLTYLYHMHACMCRERTAHDGRDKTRKFLATSFSTTNLQPSMATLNQHINECFHVFDAYHYNNNHSHAKYREPISPCKDDLWIGKKCSEEEAKVSYEDDLSSTSDVIDMKKFIHVLFLRVLTKSIFDFEFCESNKGVFDYEEYLRVQEVALRERSKQALNPLRRYMFWDNTMVDGENACKQIGVYGLQLLNICREKYSNTKSHRAKDESMDATETRKSVDSMKDNKISELIVHRLIDHNYESDTARISDLLLFLSGGHETTANTMLFLILEMSRNPEALKKLQQELDSLIRTDDGHSSTKSRIMPSMTVIGKMEYLNWCIKESMRLWPVAAGGSTRDIVTCDILYDDNKRCIPEGSTVIIHYYMMFRQPWIQDANKFMPERWSEDNPQIEGLKEMFIPFSTGKRACIGKNMAMLQLRILAANLFRYFEFEIVGEPDYEYFVTLKPTSLNMKVTARE